MMAALPEVRGDAGWIKVRSSSVRFVQQRMPERVFACPTPSHRIAGRNFRSVFSTWCRCRLRPSYTRGRGESAGPILLVAALSGLLPLARCMGTPRLWSTIVTDTTLWSIYSGSFLTLHDLIRSSLERGGETPLNLQIAIDPDHEAWAVGPGIAFQTRPQVEERPSAVASALSRGTDINYRYADDVFEIAPRLETVGLIGWPSDGPNLPWEQLLHVTYENGDSGKLSLSSLSFLRIMLSASLRSTPQHSTSPSCCSQSPPKFPHYC
ncbi:hypothetical protein B0H19DRAFT_12112 [Mycena capillaripes]|nr:hypothetical protein B0H19DRAFT_12112 [Mycena capillaripes]